MTLVAGLRFESVGPSVGSIVLWAVAVVGALAFLIYTYRGIFLRTEKRLAWLLFSMRAAGLCALALILARPVWTGAEERVDPGRVAVILDDSISMTLTDAVGRDRYGQARQAFGRLRAALESRGGQTAVDLFDLRGTPLSEGPPATATGERTDLVRGVNEVLARMRARPLAAVVLLSDGADNSGRADFRELADLRVPVFAAGFPQEADPEQLDLAVRKPQAPARVLVNNEVAVEVPVAKLGKPATEATVTLKRGSEAVASRTVSFAAGPGEQTVALKFTPSQAGSFLYTVAVESSVNEPILVNNAAAFPLQVDGEPIRVLYLEGTMRWEFKYLKARLEDDPDVNVASLLRRVNPERTELRPAKELITPDRLKTVDVVILGDMEGRFLSNPEYDALLKWLDGKNHALLVLGGYRSFGPDGWRTTPLAGALPVVLAEQPPYQHEGPFTLQLTDEGKRHPAFALSNDRVKDAETWQEQARLEGLCVVRRAKPGAVVLAVHPTLREGDDPAVVACYQNFGGGKTMALTVDTTWQWSRTPRLIGRPDTLYGRFWSQIVRWLAGRNLDEQRPVLTVSTDRTGYEPSKTVQVKVVRHPRPDLDFTNAEPAAEVRGPDGKAVRLPLKANSATPDEFTGAFTPPGGGRYEVGVRLSAGAKLLGNQGAEFLVQGSALELADPRANPRSLEDIARYTGGAYADMGQAESLADKITVKPRRRVSVERREFWHSPALFVFFVSAVSLEWFLRRRNQMV